MLFFGLLGRILGYVGKHSCARAFGGLEVLSACLLKKRLRLRSVRLLDIKVCFEASLSAHFFVACLLRKALSFWVAGDMISSDGETYCWGLAKLVSVPNSACAWSTHCSFFKRDSRT